MFINNYFTALVEFPGSQLPLMGMFRWDLVALSVAIAICGAWAGLSCLTRAESVSANSPAGSTLWKIAGGVGFGGSIWGMHFVGMLAFSLPCGISYDFLLTSVSIIPGILASLTAMTVVGRTDFGLYTRLTVGSVLMGAGIGAMHYTGMAAMRLPAILLYDPFFVALSVAVAVGLSFVALMVVEHGQRQSSNFVLRKMVAAVILGAAVASMHYVAMQAAIFYPTLEAPVAEGQLSQGIMALLVSLATLALAGAVAAASFAARLKETARNLADEVHSRTIAEKTARADQMRLQAIFDTAVEAIIVIDRHGRVQQWSRSAERIFGFSADEISDRNIAMIIDNIGLERHDTGLEQQDGLRQDRHQIGVARMFATGGEVVGRRRDGTAVPIEPSVGETAVDGEILYTLILRDISKRKEVERELLEATRAKEANELKANFLAHMSHEMRTPLNAILGFSDIMKTQTFGPLDDTYKGYAQDIFSSGSHLLNLVDALLDLSRIENNTQDVDIADVDLRAMLNDVETMLRVQAQEKNLTVATLIDNDLPQIIRSDRGKLLQILLNLVNNAVKYTPENGRVSVRAWPCKDHVRVLVEDDGIGMTDDEVSLALKPFGQVKNAFTSGLAGTGLGLPVVVSFVELLQGDMRVESEKGKGTSVRVSIPMKFVEQACLSRSAAD